MMFPYLLFYVFYAQHLNIVVEQCCKQKCVFCVRGSAELSDCLQSLPEGWFRPSHRILLILTSFLLCDPGD